MTRSVPRPIRWCGIWGCCGRVGTKCAVLALCVVPLLGPEATISSCMTAIAIRRSW